jgi:hypothetical protein
MKQDLDDKKARTIVVFRYEVLGLINIIPSYKIVSHKTVCLINVADGFTYRYIHNNIVNNIKSETGKFNGLYNIL